MAQVKKRNVLQHTTNKEPLLSTNKTDRQDMIKILLKVALNTINQTNQLIGK
jgi:hypothetical protein